MAYCRKPIRITIVNQGLLQNSVGGQSKIFRSFSETPDAHHNYPELFWKIPLDVPDALKKENGENRTDGNHRCVPFHARFWNRFILIVYQTRINDVRKPNKTYFGCKKINLLEDRSRSLSKYPNFKSVTCEIKVNNNEKFSRWLQE